jgi:hypothetical protein
LKASPSTVAAKPKASQAPDPPGSKGQEVPGCWVFVTVDPEKSDRRKGTAVHRAIREQLGRRLAPRYGEPVSVRLLDAGFAPYSDRLGLKGGGKRTGEGYVDLAFRLAGWKDMVLAEIKPANLDGLLNGKTQIDNYIEKANQSEEAKRRYGVKTFTPMHPDVSVLEPIYSLGREFVLSWCYPGLIVYKEIKQKRDKDKDEKQQSEGQRAQSQRGASAQQRSTAPSVGLPDWAPASLRRDIEASTLEDGLYRNRYQGAWPGGESTNIVVWVKTAARQQGVYREFQLYQEFPETPAFYERFARRRGLSDRQADLIRRTMADYNRDLWSLIRADPITGRSSSRSPEYARAELRTIYSEVLRGVLEASAQIAAAGAAITSVSNAMAQRSMAPTPVEPDSRSVSTRQAQSAPATTPPGELPDWASRTIQRGFDQARRQRDLVRVLEEEMHAVP